MISIKYTENSYKLPILNGIYVGQTEICTAEISNEDKQTNKEANKENSVLTYFIRIFFFCAPNINMKNTTL